MILNEGYDHQTEPGARRRPIRTSPGFAGASFMARGPVVTKRSSPRHVPGCYVKISLLRLFKDIFSREADQGRFAHATEQQLTPQQGRRRRRRRAPEASHTARNFLGFVQFSVPAFQHPPFPETRIDPKSPLCADASAGGADGHFTEAGRRPRTKTTTVRKRARLYRRLRVFSVVHLIILLMRTLILTN
jgi:hypothetical protein